MAGRSSCVKKKDGLYYLMISEGGTDLLYKLTTSGSDNIWGLCEKYDANPILTNPGTDEYFPCVGHADLFQDAKGNW